MSSSLVARRGLLTALTVFAAAALFMLGMAQGSAQALSPKPPKITGNANVVVGAGKAGKVLTRNGVRVTSVAPAKITRKGKNFVAKLPVRNVLKANRTDVPLNGGFVFRKGKRGYKVRTLNLVVRKNGKIAIGGVVQNVGSRKTGVAATNIYRVNGKAKITTQGKRTTVRIKNAKVFFTAGVAKSVRKQLKLKKAPTGQIATLNLNASRTESSTPVVDPCIANPTGPGCEPVDPCIANPTGPGCEPVDPCIANPTAEECQPAPTDPYLAQCNVAAFSKGTGTLTPASPLPALTDGRATVAPTSIEWGFKQSFRSYVQFGAGGSIHALDGATTVGGPPLISAFNFPTDSGEYAANDALDATDDQAIINGTGTALLCATGHEFRVAISNPTIVVDGLNSRIIADVDTNLTGVWNETQRVDLAKLDLEGVTPFYNRNGTQVNWGEVKANLTAAGAEAICGAVDAPACSYVEGTELDSVNIKIGTEYNVPTTGPDVAPEEGPWFEFTERLATQHPFPYPAAVGCTPGIPVGGTAAAARSIDEHVGLFVPAGDPPSTPSFLWNEDGGQPAALPELASGAAQVLGGGLDWGVRTALRGSVNGTGQFNLSGGASASHTPYVGNGTGSLPYPQAGGTGQMGGAGKYFTWPVAESNGSYDAGEAGTADDKLLLESEGTVGFCNVMAGPAPQPIMSYGTVLSNPTIVIDGENSRITVDVTTRFRQSWLRGRVDFASLNVSGVTPTSAPVTGGEALTWAAIPATLTADGASVVNVLSKAQYVAGAALDPVTVRATVPTEE